MKFLSRCSRNLPYSPVYPSHTESMALLKYFSQHSAFLMDPNGPLLVKVKPEAIDNANKKVSALLALRSSKNDSTKQHCGSYISEGYASATFYSCWICSRSRKRSAIAKYNKLRGVELKESTVTTWKASTPKIVTTTQNCVRFILQRQNTMLLVFIQAPRSHYQ